MSALVERAFSIGGHALRVRGMSGAAIDWEPCFRAISSAFPPLEPTEMAIGLDVRIGLDAHAIRPDAEPLEVEGLTTDLRFGRLPSSALLLDRGDAWAIIDGTRIEVVTTRAPSYALGINLVFRAVLLGARSLGLVPLHAGVVEVGGGGWLLVGPSGAGKSTTTLALAEAGCMPRADDVLLVDSASLSIVPVGRPFHLSPLALSSFTRWEEKRLSSAASAAGKFDVRVAPPSSAPIRPGAILLLSRPGESTRLERASVVDALPHLLTESGSIFLDPTRASESLDALRRLVESVPLLTLRPGPDVLSEPGRLRSRVEALLREGG